MHQILKFIKWAYYPLMISDISWIDWIPFRILFGTLSLPISIFIYLKYKPWRYING